MSITDYSISGKEYNLHGRQDFNTTVSMNELFQAAVKKAQEQASGVGIVVRCEELPEVEGKREPMKNFLEMLMGFMLEQFSDGHKLFLHVSCEEIKDGATPEEQKHYHIRFHTNIAPDTQWKAVHKDQLSQCQQIISAHGGTFMVNNINNAGYLFSITLPGKLK